MQPFGSELGEAAAIAVEDGRLAAAVLPAGDDDVAVSGLDFHREAATPAALGGDHRTAAAGEWLVHRIAMGAVVEHRPEHAGHRFLRAVHRRRVVLAGADRPDGRLVARALPAGVAALADRIEAGLVLPVIVAAAEHEAALHRKVALEPGTLVFASDAGELPGWEPLAYPSAARRNQACCRSVVRRRGGYHL